VAKITTLAAGYVTSLFVAELCRLATNKQAAVEAVAAILPHFDCRMGEWASWEEVGRRQQAPFTSDLDHVPPLGSLDLSCTEAKLIVCCVLASELKGIARWGRGGIGFCRWALELSSLIEWLTRSALQARALLLWRSYDCSVNGVSDAVHQTAGKTKLIVAKGTWDKLRWLDENNKLPLPSHQACVHTLPLQPTGARPISFFPAIVPFMFM
jgi:hypothetical protein